MAIFVTLNRQAQNDLGEYLALLTLCLTPLFVHLAAGVPSPTSLNFRKQPRWTDRICHYNPTSIFWRYFAITDRRIRAKCWSTADISATNAHFWTGYTWDGSEEMIEKSKHLCTKLSHRTHVDPFSQSSVKTVIVLLQAVQALYALLGSVVSGNPTFTYTTALSTLFFPLAAFGFMRLPAALWLADDFTFRNAEASDASLDQYPTIAQGQSGIELEHLKNQSSSATLLHHHDSTPSDRFHHPYSWRGVIVKLLYLTIVIGLLVISLKIFLPLGSGNGYFSATGFVTNLFFITFLGVTVITALVYMARFPRTTVIPCITSTWYKIYTYMLFLFMAVMLVIASIETRQTPCGKYTTVAAEFDCGPGLCNSALCSNSTMGTIGP